MRPIDSFSFLKANLVTTDSRDLMRYYYPIIGADGLVVYQYLVSFWDNGAKKHQFAEILNHTLFGMQRFEEALAILTGMDLVRFYQQQQDYLIELLPPLSGADFLANAVYTGLLEQKIGHLALEEMRSYLPENVQNLSKKFSEVFDATGQVALQSAKTKTNFDLESFKKLMVRDGLSFEKEASDVVALNHFAERYELTWYDTYLLARETAVNFKISLSRMQAKKEQKPLEKSNSDTFSPQEEVIIREAKADKADVFLAKIKKARQATITADERKILSDLAAMSFLDEVINIMILYTINKTKSANVNKRYLMKIANDFSYQKVMTAEDAVLKMRDFTERKKQVSTKSSQESNSNIPSWSNPDYKNETSQEEQAKLDQMKQAMLDKLRKD
ncbi:DnaD domain-containing protein [Streptococcus loxodontisalivarius]|uniref:Replication initiation and membrane attachment protein n=1 Tax=Streptococcus loxodontisalivarius TaxID=1349415 RepID=A0ABS2PUI0_9STRE|nr:DnaD domain protein [Streptococcus loxodontisalivarius]MBM7643670.1 replication initiation and membrane attachment protein [Streptococcus loxodontisalivarius]